MEVLQQIRDPLSTSSSIARALEKDPGIAIGILRIANSAAYSPSGSVTSLDHAVALVGMAQLESSLLSVGVASSLPREPVQGYDFRRFWATSAKRAEIARSLAVLFCPERESESFTAGLLQDMAVPFLAHKNPRTYGRVLDEWHENGRDLAELEREQFAWDHAEVATWICGKWGLPENIALAIGAHHDNSDGEVDLPLPVSYVACLREGDDHPGLETLIENIQSNLGLEEEEAQSLVDSSIKKAEEFAGLLA